MCKTELNPCASQITFSSMDELVTLTKAQFKFMTDWARKNNKNKKRIMEIRKLMKPRKLKNFANPSD